MMVLLIMLASFAQVGLGCLQAINVVEDRRHWAVLTSIAQGLAALTLYRTAPQVDSAEAVFGFLFGGVMGGQIAMYVGRRRRLVKPLQLGERV